MDLQVWGDYTRNGSTFTIKDFRFRKCRDCERKIERGEKVKRTRSQDPREKWVCKDCFTDAKGVPILQ